LPEWFVLATIDGKLGSKTGFRGAAAISAETRHQP